MAASRSLLLVVCVTRRLDLADSVRQRHLHFVSMLVVQLGPTCSRTSRSIATSQMTRTTMLSLETDFGTDRSGMIRAMAATGQPLQTRLSTSTTTLLLDPVAASWCSTVP